MQLSPAQTRRQRRRDEARRAILDATEELMIEHEGDSFSIRGLAERCGYTAPTIYHYFGDKNGLVDALLEERFARLLAIVDGVETGQDPVDDLRQTFEAFLRFGERNPAFYRLILSSRDGSDRTPPSAEAVRRILEQPWLALARAGRLDRDDPAAASQALWALLHGLTALRIARPDFEWSPQLVEVALDAMLRGLVRPGPKGVMTLRGEER